MTYRQPPVCRYGIGTRGSCGRPAVGDQDTLPEGDRRLCEKHLAEVRALRAELWKPQPVGRPATPPASAPAPVEKKHPTPPPAYQAGWL